MQELNNYEISNVNGGIAFLPGLAVVALGSFVGGYIYGKLTQNKEEPSAPETPTAGCEPTC